MAEVTSAERVDLTGPAAVLDYFADPVWVPAVDFEVATLIVVAAAATAVQTAAGAAFVSEVESAVVAGVVWVMSSHPVYAVYLQLVED